MNTTYASTSGTKTLPTHAKNFYMPRAKFANINSYMTQRSKAQANRPQSRHAYMYTRRHTPRTNFRHQK